MRRLLLISAVACALLAARGETVLIVIEGETVAQSIVIGDPAILARFRVGTGPGTGELVGGALITKDDPSMIVDWRRRVDSVPKGMQVYEVSLAVMRRD